MGGRGTAVRWLAVALGAVLAVGADPVSRAAATPFQVAPSGGWTYQGRAVKSIELETWMLAETTGRKGWRGGTAPEIAGPCTVDGQPGGTWTWVPLERPRLTRRRTDIEVERSIQAARDPDGDGIPKNHFAGSSPLEDPPFVPPDDPYLDGLAVGAAYHEGYDAGWQQGLDDGRKDVEAGFDFSEVNYTPILDPTSSQPFKDGFSRGYEDGYWEAYDVDEPVAGVDPYWVATWDADGDGWASDDDPWAHVDQIAAQLRHPRQRARSGAWAALGCAVAAPDVTTTWTLGTLRAHDGGPGFQLYDFVYMPYGTGKQVFAEELFFWEVPFTLFAEVGMNPAVPLVNLETWLWLEDYQSRIDMFSVDALWRGAKFNGRLDDVKWVMGDGEGTVTCEGLGEPYSADRAGEAAPCGYTFRRSSAYSANQRFLVQAYPRWHVTFRVCCDGSQWVFLLSGPATVVDAAWSVPVAVREAEAVVVD